MRYVRYDVHALRQFALTGHFRYSVNKFSVYLKAMDDWRNDDDDVDDDDDNNNNNHHNYNRLLASVEKQLLTF